jgi:ferric-dicitrate binding protein FerR (iron transport regulator)
MLHARTPPEDRDQDAEVSGPTGGVHPAFEAIVQSLLAEDDDREKNAARVADALDALLRGESPELPAPARAERPAAVRRPAYGVALLGLTALALSWALQHPRVQTALESLATLLDR